MLEAEIRISLHGSRGRDSTNYLGSANIETCLVVFSVAEEPLVEGNICPLDSYCTIYHIDYD